jgi:hypothetical protein
MSTDPFQSLLDDVVLSVDEDLAADPGCPDFAAVLARAHELDPQRVPAEAVAEVAQWAPVVSIQQGHRRRRTREDLELAAVIDGVRAHVEEEVAQRLATPPLLHAAKPIPAPRARRLWAVVLAAAAVLVLVGAGVLLQGGRMLLSADTGARNAGTDILIMARTDARACVSLNEAIARCQAFHEIGADISFLEAPVSEDEMRRYCTEVPGPKMANLIEGGKTPLLSPAQLEAIGYTIAVYPLTMLNVSIRAMREALGQLKSGQRASAAMDFESLKSAVGFPAYYAEEARYKA